MNPKQDERRGLKIPEPLHKRIGHESIETGLTMGRLIEIAWDAYEREKLKKKPKREAAQETAA